MATIHPIKKVLWTTLGLLSLGMAYIGVITPGIPYSCFVVFAAYCFSKGSERLHTWIYNHKLFGPFLTNWNEKRVFPTKMKFFMLAMMTTSLIIMSFTVPVNGVIYTGIFMFCVAVWAWRFPGSIAEHDLRIAQGRRIGWFNNYI
jgi:uncharacterized membrane protein YbaN (DUF454 family)